MISFFISSAISGSCFFTVCGLIWCNLSDILYVLCINEVTNGYLSDSHSRSIIEDLRKHHRDKDQKFHLFLVDLKRTLILVQGMWLFQFSLFFLLINLLMLSRNRLSDIRRVVSFAKNNYVIYSENGVEKFLIEANNLQLKHRDLSRYPFQTFSNSHNTYVGIEHILYPWLTTIYQHLFKKKCQNWLEKLKVRLLHIAIDINSRDSMIV